MSEAILRSIEQLGARMDASVAQLSTRMDASIAQLSARIDSVCARVDDLSARVDALGARVDNLGVRLDDLGAHVAARFSALEARLANLEGRLATIENRLTTVENVVADLDGRIKLWPDVHYLAGAARAQMGYTRDIRADVVDIRIKMDGIYQAMATDPEVQNLRDEIVRFRDRSIDFDVRIGAIESHLGMASNQLP